MLSFVAIRTCEHRTFIPVLRKPGVKVGDTIPKLYAMKETDVVNVCVNLLDQARDRLVYT